MNHIKAQIERDLESIKDTFSIMLERAGRDNGESSEEWEIKLEKHLSLSQNNLLKVIAEEVEGKRRKPYKEGDFLEHRDEYNKAYNQAVDDFLQTIKEARK